MNAEQDQGQTSRDVFHAKSRSKDWEIKVVEWSLHGEVKWSVYEFEGGQMTAASINCNSISCAVEDVHDRIHRSSSHADIVYLYAEGDHRMHGPHREVTGKKPALSF